MNRHILTAAVVAVNVAVAAALVGSLTASEARRPTKVVPSVSVDVSHAVAPSGGSPVVTFLVPERPTALVDPPADMLAPMPTPEPTEIQPPEPGTSSADSDGGCGPALSYLRANAAPEFSVFCGDLGEGIAAATTVGGCSNNPVPHCEVFTITIDPDYADCQVAWKNEAANSWWAHRYGYQGPKNPMVALNASGELDPYGSC